jgi:hypothetical protein
MKNNVNRRKFNTIIQNLKSAFNNNVKKIRKYYLELIIQIIRSNKKPNIKKFLINKIKAELNNAINELKNKLNNDINAIYQQITNQQVPLVVELGNNKNALLIGINYIGTQNELYGCINDTDSISNLLLSRGFKDIQFLTDNTSEKPIRNNIINKFTNLLTNAKSGDTVFLFYSGHGSYITDNNNNEQTNNDQLIVPLDLNVIVDDELKSIINNHLKSNVTLIALFDCCFSESVLDLKYQYLDSLNNNNNSININETNTNGNVIMISGCTDNQTSEDAIINNLPQGALTWAFLQTFNSKKNQSWRELLKGMRTTLQNNGFSQIPQLASGKLINIDANICF